MTGSTLRDQLLFLLLLTLTTLTTNISILKWRARLTGFTVVEAVVAEAVTKIISANYYIVGNIRPNPPMLRLRVQSRVLL